MTNVTNRFPTASGNAAPLRPNLPPLPPMMRKLPIDERGYPVPWFVMWIDGKPDFRIVDGEKIGLAMTQGRCWVCGEILGAYMAFTVGPMCAVNRISSEPPSHRVCAEFSAKACPFILMPKASRRDANMPEEARPAAGHMIARNPGVYLIWITKSCKAKPAPLPDGSQGVLFEMGPPLEVICYAQGRPAEKEEIRESFESGLPILRGAIDPGSSGFLSQIRQLEIAAEGARRLLNL